MNVVNSDFLKLIPVSTNILIQTGSPSSNGALSTTHSLLECNHTRSAAATAYNLLSRRLFEIDTHGELAAVAAADLV